MEWPGERTGAEASLGRALRGVDPRQVAVLCIGNPDRGDDGFGPAVAERLRGLWPGPLFDCRTTPENDLPRAAACEPAAVLIVDAVHFGGEAGELRLLPADAMETDALSTHAASLSVTAQFLREACGARVLVLAAQPAGLALGEGLSAPMARAVGEAVEALAEFAGQ